jgi:hypothetical protein
MTDSLADQLQGAAGTSYHPIGRFVRASFGKNVDVGAS